MVDMNRASELYRAWQSNSEWKELFLDSCSRELSKTGSLSAHEEEMQQLAHCFSKEDAIALYQSLQLSSRPDYEWRDAFLAIFRTVTETDLPKPIVDEEEARRFAAEQRAKAELRDTHDILPDDQIPF